MNITREKLVGMWGLINRIAMEKTSVKFHYILAKNKRLIKPEIESLQEAQQPPEDYMKYDKIRQDLCKVMAEKDDQGNPKVVNNEYVMIEETKEEFDKKIEELKIEHKETIDKMDEQKAQFEILIKEDIDIDLVHIPFSVLPESIIGNDVDMLFDIIDEDN